MHVNEIYSEETALFWLKELREIDEKTNSALMTSCNFSTSLSLLFVVFLQ